MIDTTDPFGVGIFGDLDGKPQREGASDNECVICGWRVWAWQKQRWVTHHDGQPRLVHIACERDLRERALRESA